MQTPRIDPGALGQRLVRALSGAQTAVSAGDAVLQEVARALGSPLGVLWLRDDDSELLRWKQDWAATDELDEMRRIGRRLTVTAGVGLPGTVMETLEPAWSQDIAGDPNFPRAELALGAGLRSAVAAPVVSADGVLGVIEFFGRSAGAPSAEQLHETATAGRQLAAYLARLRIEDRLRASEESSASIVQAALDCVITMDHHGRILGFNPAAEATFGYRRDAALGEPLADLIIPPELREAHRLALARYLESRGPAILGRRLELTGMRADGETFPVELTVTRVGTGEPPVFAGFIRDITDRLELEAEQSRLLQAALLARARAEAAEVRTDDAREEAERSRARIALLAQAGRMMAESMDWETTLGAVVRSAVPAIAQSCTLTVVEPAGRLRVAAVAHEDPERERLAREVADRLPLDPDAPAGAPRVIRTGEPEVLADIGPDSVPHDREQLRRLTGLGVRHSVTAPLKTPAGVIGALSFTLGDSGRRFSTEDLEVITSLAARAGLHIQNARLYTERSHIARTLQASLRPRPLPAIPGVDLAARFLPAGDQNEVGGDFYDLFLSGDGVWTAIVGDVSGKGPEAAAITALARHTLRTASMLQDAPAANLALLNRALFDDSASGNFCTLFYARLCPDEGGIDMRFANGGHPAPLLVRADGSVETVEAGRGPLVGGVPHARFEEGRLRLAPGELLLVYTDGVTEIRTRDLADGEGELHATLAAHAGGSAEDVVAAVQRRTLEIHGGAPRDDIALVAIRAGASLAP